MSKVPPSQAHGKPRNHPRGPFRSIRSPGNEATHTNVTSHTVEFLYDVHASRPPRAAWSVSPEAPPLSDRDSTSRLALGGRNPGPRGRGWGTEGSDLTPAPVLAPRVSSPRLGFAPSRAHVGEVTASAPVTQCRACDTHSRHVNLPCALLCWWALFHRGDKPQPRGWTSGQFPALGSQSKAGVTHTCLGRCVCSGRGHTGAVIV